MARECHLNLSKMPRTSSEISRLSAILVVLSCLSDGVILAFASAPSSDKATLFTGWIAVCFASLIFSTTTIPMKDPQLQHLEIDTTVFSLFSGFGVFLVSVPLSVYLESVRLFEFKPFAILAAADIFIINALAVKAVDILGVAIAPGVWSGCGMIASFLLGSLAFQEGTKNPISAGIAMGLLVIGVYCVSTSKEANTTADFPTTAVMELVVDRQESGIDANEISNTFLPAQETTLGVQDAKPHDSGRPISILSGLFYCFATGLFDGALMAPFKLSGSVGSADNIRYLSSFGLSAGFVSPLLFAAFIMVTQRPWPSILQLKAGFVPGVTSGILWACANLLGVLGTHVVGMSIAFPITQTCALISAVWGVFFFGEKVNDVKRFLLGLVAVVIGSYFLASASTSQTSQ